MVEQKNDGRSQNGHTRTSKSIPGRADWISSDPLDGVDIRRITDKTPELAFDAGVSLPPQAATLSSKK